MVVQVLLFKQVALAGPYFTILLYPLLLLLLPLQAATPYLVLLGFATGMTVDFFYGSLGVHASAGAFSGLIRPGVLGAFAPKGGYSGKEPIFAPAYVGWQTFLSAAALFFGLHIFWYFSVDAFTFVYYGMITLKSALCFGLSMIFVVLYTALFNPKN